MRVGSLVEYIGPEESKTLPGYGLLITPKNKVPYTIRDIKNDRHGTPIAYVDEHIVGYNQHGQEVGMNLSSYRELLPPEEIAEAMEEVNEVLKEQELEPCR